MSYKIIDLPALGRPFNATDIIEVSANGTGSYKANIGNFTLGGENYIFVNSNGTPAQNGAAVKSAYTAAQAMTPNGVAKSATNRVVILLAPGYYTFNEAVDGAFLINTSYIDFQSLSGTPDVYFSSIQVKSGPVNGLNIVLVGIDTTKNSYYSHGAFAISSIGDSVTEYIVAKNCVGGNYSFSSFSKGFYGEYDNCVGEYYSFCSAGDGTSPAGISDLATGSFSNFGTIKNCTASDFSFVAGINSVSVPAGTVANYGTIENCKSTGLNSFCCSEFRALNAGTIKNCNSGDYSFVTVNDSIGTGMASNTGAIMNCTVAGSGMCLYGGGSISPTASYNLGMISSCTASYGSSATYAFATSIAYNGNNAGVILNCYLDGSGFCGPNGINSGYIIECSAIDESFCSGSPSANSGQILRCTLLDWAFTVGTPTAPGRVVLGIDTTGVVNF